MLYCPPQLDFLSFLIETTKVDSASANPVTTNRLNHLKTLVLKFALHLQRCCSREDLSPPVVKAAAFKFQPCETSVKIVFCPFDLDLFSSLSHKLGVNTHLTHRCQQLLSYLIGLYHLLAAIRLRASRIVSEDPTITLAV